MELNSVVCPCWQGKIDFNLGKLSVLDDAFIIPIAEFQCGIAVINVSILV